MIADYLFDVGSSGFDLEKYFTIGRDESRGKGEIGFDDSSRGWDG